jgi:hypothetical protein
MELSWTIRHRALATIAAVALVAAACSRAPQGQTPAPATTADEGRDTPNAGQTAADAASQLPAPLPDDRQEVPLIVPEESPVAVDVKIDGPATIDVGRQATLQVSITNSGRQRLENFAVRLLPIEGLELIDADSIPAKIAALNPSETRQFKINVRPAAAGTYMPTIEVVHGDEVVASNWLGLDVKGDSQTPDRTLGSPLVENAESLERLDPVDPIWFDKQNRSVVMLGSVCQREAPLETFACLRGSKEHESVLAVPVKAYVVHAGLMAAGAVPGTPVQFEPEYKPATGPEIEVTVIWKDTNGEIRRARGQDWVRDVRTKKPMTYPWVFAGSRFVEDSTTGERYYQAEGGELICVSNFPSALLDLPVESSDSNAELLFEANPEQIPPLDTPVTIVLTPRNGDASKGP